MWVELPHPEDKESTYWHNPVLGAIQWEQPPGPQLVQLDDAGGQLLLEDEDSLVMPSRTHIQNAKRWDLHHAILRQGGYQKVKPGPESILAAQAARCSAAASVSLHPSACMRILRHPGVQI